MIWSLLALFLGGILKGATGAGAPIIAVPVMAILVDVPFAIAILAVPNLVSNLWQGWTNRMHMIDRRFTATLALSGALGAGIGTFILANFPREALLIVVSAAVFAYIGFRLAKPHWVLPFALAKKLALPVGVTAGMLQGAAGISAPVSITFLNALRTDRAAFVATISALFAGMAIVQTPLLVHYGILTWERFLWSCLAILPLLAGMPVGAALARHLSREAFDRIILTMLTVVALRLIYDAVV